MAFGFGSRGGRGQDAATVSLYLDNSAFLAELNETDREWVQSMQGMTREALKLELAEKRLANSLRIYGDNSAQAKRAIVNLSEAQEQMRRTANSAHDATKKQQRTIIDSIKWFGLYSAGLGAVYAVGRAFTSTLQKAGDFQREMNVLGAVTNASAAEMELARKKAVELGRDITLPATSAADAATAMVTLSKAGLDMRNAMSGSEGVLRLAAAAQIDVAEATNIAAKSLVSFGLAGTETARVADIFANAANASVGEIPDFALALSQSAQVAKSWNLTIEETVATLATFAQAGIQGSDAGTSLRVMLSRLAPTTGVAKKAFKELEISAFDSQQRIKPYHDILTQLHDAFKKLSPEQQKVNVQMIFGQDAQRGAGIAILNTIKNYDTMLGKIKETGTAQKYAAAINSGYVGSLDAFKSAVETLQISIGTNLLPEMTKALKSATTWVNEMEKSGSATREVKKAVEDVTVVVKGFVGAVKLAKTVLEPFVELMGGVENTVKAAFGLWLVIRLRAIATGLGFVSTQAYAAAGGYRALAAAQASATGAGAAGGVGRAGRLGRLGATLPLIGTAIVGGTLLHEEFDEPNEITAAQLKDPAFRKRIRDTFGAAALSKLDRAAARGEITGAGSNRGRNDRGANSGDPRNRPKADTGGKRPGDVGGSSGDGLTQLQRLELAAGNASLTGGLGDDLSAARGLAAYYRKVASNENLKGDELFKARQDLLSAQQNVQSIEDQIAQDRQQAVDKAASKRKAATAKRLAAEKRAAANQYRLDAEASNQLRKLYDKAPWKMGSDGQYHYVGAKGKTAKTGSGSEGPDFAKLSFEFLQGLQGTTNQFGSNFSGAVDANGRIMTHLTRKIAESLDTVTAGQRNPEARYNRLEAEAAMAASF